MLSLQGLHVLLTSVKWQTNAVKCYHSDATEKVREYVVDAKKFELFQSPQHPNIVEIVGTVATQNEAGSLVNT